MGILWAGFLLVEFSESIQLGFQLVEPTIAYSSERERPSPLLSEAYDRVPTQFDINQRPSAEHGPFEWPSSCHLLCRWSLIYCDSETTSSRIGFLIL